MTPSPFFKVTGPKELWGWLKQEFLPNIYSQAWYNGLEEKTDGYTANKMSIIIGMPWMRQLRIKKSKPLENYFSRCNPKFFFEEKVIFNFNKEEPMSMSTKKP